MAKHTLIVIGFTGDHTCYLDVPREEAEFRYRRDNNGALENVTVLEFDDEFRAYAVSDMGNAP